MRKKYGILWGHKLVSGYSGNEIEVEGVEGSIGERFFRQGERQLDTSVEFRVLQHGWLPPEL